MLDTMFAKCVSLTDKCRNILNKTLDNLVYVSSPIDSPKLYQDFDIVLSINTRSKCINLWTKEENRFHFTKIDNFQFPKVDESDKVCNKVLLRETRNILSFLPMKASLRVYVGKSVLIYSNNQKMLDNLEDTEEVEAIVRFAKNLLLKKVR